jgi:hypothetical protein
VFVLFCLPLTAVVFLSSCGPSDVATAPKETEKPRELQRVPVTSSNLQSVGYDEESRILTIEFRNGSVYEYEGVPPDVYSELMSAKSHGKYFHRQIRDAGYATHRVH